MRPFLCCLCIFLAGWLCGAASTAQAQPPEVFPAVWFDQGQVYQDVGIRRIVRAADCPGGVCTLPTAPVRSVAAVKPATSAPKPPTLPGAKPVPVPRAPEPFPGPTPSPADTLALR